MRPFFYRLNIMKVTVIGVAGGTGSGKSTLVKQLQEAFKGDDVPPRREFIEKNAHYANIDA